MLTKGITAIRQQRTFWLVSQAIERLLESRIPCEGAWVVGVRLIIGVVRGTRGTRLGGAACVARLIFGHNHASDNASDNQTDEGQYGSNDLGGGVRPC
jgi:hypothetical protein